MQSVEELITELRGLAEKAQPTEAVPLHEHQKACAQFHSRADPKTVARLCDELQAARRERDVFDAEARRTAVLFAASEEMLTVLKEADSLLGYFHWDSAYGRTDKFEMVQKIRAAIEKATQKAGA